ALVLACARSIGGQCEAITQHPHPGRSPRRPRTPIAQKLWEGLHPGTVPVRHAIRLALAAVISSIAAIFVNDEHAAWIAITAVMVLRPDIPSTSVRTIGRIMGTLVGAAVVVALALAVGSDPTAVAAIAVVFALLTFAYQMANYAIFVFGVVGVIIMLSVVQSGDPLVVAEARVLDVLAGSVLAVLASWIVPIWTISTLPQKLADYSRLTGEWLGAFATDLDRGVLRSETNDRLRRRARACVMTLRTSIARAEVEPGDRHVDVELVHAIEIAITDGVRQALATVAPLMENPRADPAAAGCTQHASDDLLEAAWILSRAGRVVAARSTKHSSSASTRNSAPMRQPAAERDGEVLTSMIECERQAHRALELALTVLPQTDRA
ncbi:MAG: FUSC family protein, partial [Actinomycetes bacterium]